MNFLLCRSRLFSKQILGDLGSRQEVSAASKLQDSKRSGWVRSLTQSRRYCCYEQVSFGQPLLRFERRLAWAVGLALAYLRDGMLKIDGRNFTPCTAETPASGLRMALLRNNRRCEVAPTPHLPLTACSTLGSSDHAADDERLFIMEIVTSPQHGGAERIACDLARELPAHGVRSRLVSLGKPHRSSLQAPADYLDLSEIARNKKITQLSEIAIAEGVDILHVHLTNHEQTRTLSASGIPVIASVHNSRAAWPTDWQFLENSGVSSSLPARKP